VVLAGLVAVGVFLWKRSVGSRQLAVGSSLKRHIPPTPLDKGGEVELLPKGDPMDRMVNLMTLQMMQNMAREQREAERAQRLPPGY